MALSPDSRIRKGRVQMFTEKTNISLDLDMFTILNQDQKKMHTLSGQASSKGRIQKRLNCTSSFSYRCLSDKLLFFHRMKQIISSQHFQGNGYSYSKCKSRRIKRKKKFYIFYL